jgi:hypothetical protein
MRIGFLIEIIENYYTEKITYIIKCRNTDYEKISNIKFNRKL